MNTNVERKVGNSAPRRVITVEFGIESVWQERGESKPLIIIVSYIFNTKEAYSCNGIFAS
jgi:hypothetical protein